MSRIGKLPVSLPTGVTAELLPGNVVKVKGPHGELSQPGSIQDCPFPSAF